MARRNINSTKKETKERLSLVAKLINKYIACRPILAMKELFNIDFIRKNFAPTTIYTYLMQCKRMKKIGEKPKKMSPDLAEAFESITKAENKTLGVNVQEEPKVSVETKPVTLDEIKEKIDKLQAYYDNKVVEVANANVELDKQKERNENELTLIRQAVNHKVIELQELQMKLLSEKIEQEL